MFSKYFASIKELALHYLDSIFIPITQVNDPEPRFEKSPNPSGFSPKLKAVA
jgi:hypothetical protein